jgi:predicted nicotinamide N-methyase
VSEELVTRSVELPSGELRVLQPADSAELPDDGAVEWAPLAPYWSVLWRSGVALAQELDGEPLTGVRVVELGCGLALPSIVAARAGADVLATDGSEDAVAFAAHSLALNDLEGEVAQVDWAEQGDALAARGPWDLVLAADVFYLQENVKLALRLLPWLLAPGGEVWLADPRRAGTRDFLASARASFKLATETHGQVAVHRLTSRYSRTPKPPMGSR